MLICLMFGILPDPCTTDFDLVEIIPNLSFALIANGHPSGDFFSLRTAEANPLRNKQEKFILTCGMPAVQNRFPVLWMGGYIVGFHRGSVSCFCGGSGDSTLARGWR